MIFIFKSAITLALLYVCFFAFLSKETFHRFNRVMLVGIMVASLVVPLIHLTTTEPTVINERLWEMEMDFQPVASPHHPDVQREVPFDWTDCIIIGYIVGVVVMCVRFVIGLVAVGRLLHSGLRHTDNRGNTVVLSPGNMAPFSVMKFIVMSVDDYETNRDYILTHEQEHIRLGHTFDLMLLEVMKIVQWFNPFIWFLGRDLKAVHEFEADRAVIDRGIDAKEYQRLLVRKAVGVRLHPLTNSLNHNSLKRRFIMMYHKESSRWMMLKGLCAIPVAAITVAAFARPQVIEKMQTAITASEAKVAKSVTRVVEQIPLLPKSPVVANEPQPDGVTAAETASVVDARSDEAANREPAATDASVLPEQEPAADVRQLSQQDDGVPTYSNLPVYAGGRRHFGGLAVKRNAENTLVMLAATCNKDREWFKIGGSENQTFIEDVETGDHYKVRRVVDNAVVFGGKGFYVSGMKGKTWTVTLEFPPLPDNVRYIRFWHLASWINTNNRNIQLKDIEEQ